MPSRLLSLCGCLLALAVGCGLTPAIAQTSVTTAELRASDGSAGDGFGRSVAISGDSLIVGAYGHDGAGSDAGAAYVFRYERAGFAAALRTGVGAALGGRPSARNLPS